VSLLSVAVLWALVITLVATAVKAGLSSGRLSITGAALAIAATIAAFPLATAVTGALAVSWQTLFISAFALFVPTITVGYFVFKSLVARR